MHLIAFDFESDNIEFCFYCGQPKNYNLFSIGSNYCPISNDKCYQ